MRSRMTAGSLELPDTDWHVRQLYAFARELGATIVAANYSRYVVDLNRAASDDALYAGQVSTGLCPQRTFAGDAIYAAGQDCTASEQEQRISRYWQPYHDRLQRELARIHEQFGYALLWDAHSIPGLVPMLFDGRLPNLNIGTYDGRSCADELQQAVALVASQSAYSTAVNGRFRGGYITRHYGAPGNNVHAIQLELAQSTYMDENSRRYDNEKAAQLVPTLQSMLQAFVDGVQQLSSN